jgi:hypothetical protein
VQAVRRTQLKNRDGVEGYLTDSSKGDPAVSKRPFKKCPTEASWILKAMVVYISANNIKYLSFLC